MTLALVVDASVGAKWFLPEDDSHKADVLWTRGVKLVAPDIFRVEVGSSITRRVRNRLMTPGEAQEQCERLLAMLDRQKVFLLDSAKDFPDALMLSLQLNHPVADCLYLSLAQRLDSPLVTADAVLRDRAKAVYDKVELL